MTDSDKYGHIGLWTERLIVREGAELYGPRIFLYANKSIDIEKNVLVNSSRENECYIGNDGNENLYECMNFDEHPEKITFDNLIEYYNR